MYSFFPGGIRSALVSTPTHRAVALQSLMSLKVVDVSTSWSAPVLSLVVYGFNCSVLLTARKEHEGFLIHEVSSHKICDPLYKILILWIIFFADDVDRSGKVEERKFRKPWALDLKTDDVR